MKPQPTDRCRQLLEQVSRYLDGDLTPAKRRTVGQHLRRCPCCQHLANGLKHTVDTCHKAGVARLPADVRARAKARITTLLASGAVTAPRR
jgi:anti-sigma factor RsiW